MAATAFEARKGIILYSLDAKLEALVYAINIG